MTLIAGALNDDYALQVSDRRLTWSNGKIDDEANKTILLESDAYRFIVGFTGFAGAVKANTCEWLARALHEAAMPDIQLELMLSRLSTAASALINAVRGVNSAARRLTIMFTGFANFESGVFPAMAFVTNFQDFDTFEDSPVANPYFRYYCKVYNHPPPVWSLQRIGLWPEFADAEINSVLPLVQSQKPADAVIGKLIEVIREIASRPVGATVGKQLMSAVLPRDFAMPGIFGYHSNEIGLTYYTPTIVIARRDRQGILGGATITATGPNPVPIVVPPQHAKARCACKSGKLYRDCHGKRPKVPRKLRPKQ